MVQEFMGPELCQKVVPYCSIFINIAKHGEEKGDTLLVKHLALIALMTDPSSSIFKESLSSRACVMTNLNLDVVSLLEPGGFSDNTEHYH
jgi:hypothetical protein